MAVVVMDINKYMAETATGISESRNGPGPFYDDNGIPLTTDQARILFTDGDGVKVPNAGAGSYRSIFQSFGFMEVEDIDTSSSAGDWAFAIGDSDFWYLAWQEHRYPYHGFRYTSDPRLSFGTLAELLEYVKQ
jgi:hypothetical protein